MKTNFIVNTRTIDKINNMIPYVRYCNEDRYIEPWKLDTRTIGDFEFVFITKGKGQFIIGENTYDVKANDLILISPDIPHEGKSTTLPFEFLCMHFDMYISKAQYPIECSGQHIFDKVPNNPLIFTKAVLDIPEFMQVQNPNYFSMLFRKMINEVKEQNEEFILMVKSLFIEILCMLVRQTKTESKKHPVLKDPPVAIIEIKKYLDANYMHKISLSDISSQVHLEATYISKIFKKFIGCSITQYLLQYRLSAAGKKLCETDKKIEEIAYESGFYDLHHFSKVFKAHIGISPSKYRLIR